MTDDELIAAFEAGALPAGTLHHFDHVRVGFLLMCRYPAWQALGRFSVALRALATAQGDATKYHETISWAFLLLIQERLARWTHEHRRTPTWDEFAAANADLLSWPSPVLKTYYRAETLASDLARTTFVMPDAALGRGTD